MEELITSYLIQKKECGLPLLGSFKIKTKPASLDIASKQMFSQTDEILFSETGDYLSENLVGYISSIQKIPANEAERRLHNWCLHEKAQLDSGKKIVFDSVGSLQKNSEGKILFQRSQSILFSDTIIAERVIHKNDGHVVLVGDKETTSGAMNEFYKDEVAIPQKNSLWKMWALILFIISMLVFCLYFYDHDFSENTIGNQSSFPASSPTNTYSVPK